MGDCLQLRPWNRELFHHFHIAHNTLHLRRRHYFAAVACKLSKSAGVHLHSGSRLALKARGRVFLQVFNQIFNCYFFKGVP